MIKVDHHVGQANTCHSKTSVGADRPTTMSSLSHRGSPDLHFGPTLHGGCCRGALVLGHEARCKQPQELKDRDTLVIAFQSVNVEVDHKCHHGVLMRSDISAASPIGSHIATQCPSWMDKCHCGVSVHLTFMQHHQPVHTLLHGVCPGRTNDIAVSQCI
jgi:hypothetical protein